MSSIESLTFENGKMVLYVDYGTKSQPDKSKLFYNPAQKREAELAELTSTIITEAIGSSSKSKRISHENSDDPIKGYTITHENNVFKIGKRISSGYNTKYSVETDIWRKDKESAFHSQILVPGYSPFDGGGYIVDMLGLTVGNQGHPYDIMPHGNIPDEKAWKLHKQFLNNTIRSALQLKPQEVAGNISDILSAVPPQETAKKVSDDIDESIQNKVWT